MAQAAATPYVPEAFSTLYEQLKQMLLPDAAKIDYQPRSRAELRAAVEDTLYPNLQAAMRERQANTQRTNASIDADAAARGMGSSTWGTDVKNRNYTTEAKDLAGMRGTYNSTLASNLNSLLSEQESRKLAADQYNKSAEDGARSKALNIAIGNYDTWGAPVAQPASGGSGSSNSKLPGGDPAKMTGDEYLKYIQEKNPYAYTTSYDTRAVAAQKAKAEKDRQAYMLKKYGNMGQILGN